MTRHRLSKLLTLSEIQSLHWGQHSGQSILVWLCAASLSQGTSLCPCSGLGLGAAWRRSVLLIPSPADTEEWSPKPSPTSYF